jgi:hypothetical protein
VRALSAFSWQLIDLSCSENPLKIAQDSKLARNCRCGAVIGETWRLVCRSMNDRVHLDLSWELKIVQSHEGYP